MTLRDGTARDSSVAPGVAEPRTVPVPAWARWRGIAYYALDTELLLGFRVRRELRTSRAILEVGSGYPARTWHRHLSPEQLDRGVGLDVFRPYLEARATESMRWRRPVQGSGLHLPFRDRSFDAVLALDVIEHLPKEDGYRLLREMERVARRKVIVFTPNGFLPQAGDDNPHQEHLSGWTVSDLERQGYRVGGVRGWRPLRTARNRLVVAPAPLGFALSVLSSPIAWVRPSAAFQILGVRSLDPTTERPR
ncbi:MAG: class I SAM-dependent methyltransferase [Thermoplasmata archaeon]|nr:class I SAM-dependent methyltransferase [Thermoplasmata archaeon]